jgi:hypothetical protein
MNAILEDCFTKIDQEPEAESGQPEIREKLLEMSRHKFLDRLQFEDDKLAHNHIHREPDSNLIPSYIRGAGI